MKSRGYRLSVTEEDDGSWTIVAPDLPGMVAAGRSLAAAARRLPDAIDSWIKGAEEAGLPIPQPSREEVEYSGKFLFRMAKSLHRRLAEGAYADGVSLNSYCTTLLAGAVEARSKPLVADVRPQRVQNWYWAELTNRSAFLKFETHTMPMNFETNRIVYGRAHGLVTSAVPTTDAEVEGRDIYALPS